MSRDLQPLTKAADDAWRHVENLERALAKVRTDKAQFEGMGSIGRRGRYVELEAQERRLERGIPQTAPRRVQTAHAVVLGWPETSGGQPSSSRSRESPCVRMGYDGPEPTSGTGEERGG